MTLAYHYNGSLYLNITNRCSCACVFCIRKEYEGVGDGDSLWLEREPTAQEVVDAAVAQGLLEYDEVVFCGYGEPTEKLEVLLEVARSIKALKPGIKVRLNTNGLSDHRTGEPTAHKLQDLVDCVSISLNAPDDQIYREVTRPANSDGAFASMLNFAQTCKSYIPDVQFTVVDVISAEEIARCQAIADELEIPLRVRAKT